MPGTVLLNERVSMGPTASPEPEPEAGGKSKKPPPIQLEPEDASGADHLLGGSYVAAKSYLKVRMKLDHPIIERPATPPRPEQEASDICPPRPPLPRFLQPKDPTREFQQQVKKTLEEVVVSYRKNNGVATPTAESEKDFMYELSSTGKYHSLKEMLKKSVVRIVREKFKKDGHETVEDMENFHNDLYVYLMQQGTDAINSAFEEGSREAKYVDPLPEVGTLENFQLLVTEAELVDQLHMGRNHSEAVVKYHDECIRLAGDDATVWFDYAMFALKIENISKTDQCLQEALSLDGTNPKILLVYGVTIAMRDLSAPPEDADAFFQAAVDNSEEVSVIAWTIRALALELMEREEDCKYAKMMSHWTQQDIDEGRILAADRTRRTYRDKGGVDIANKRGGGPPLLQAARFLLDMHAPLFAEKALQGFETEMSGPKAPKMAVKMEHLILQARLAMDLGDLTRAEECLIEAVHLERPRTSRMSAHMPEEKMQEKSIFTVEAWTLLAHVQYLQKKNPEAIASYASSLAISNSPFDNLVYLRYAELLITAGGPEELEKAKQVALKACTSFPTATSWLFVGIACYKRGQFDQAEEALVEANVADINNGVVWAYLCLVCMQLRRDDEADRALQLALRRGIDEPDVLRELGTVFVAAGKPAIAESALREALKMQEDATVRRALADALAAQNDPEAAIVEFKTVVNAYDKEADRIYALEQLEKLLNLVNRPAESAKYGAILGPEEY